MRWGSRFSDRFFVGNARMALVDLVDRLRQIDPLDPVPVGDHHGGRASQARGAVNIDRVSLLEQVRQALDGFGQVQRQVRRVEIADRDAAHFDSRLAMGLGKPRPIAAQAREILLGLGLSTALT
jgi:hypothetical protein